MSKYTRNADGTYSVAGVLTVANEEQAIALTTETGVFDTRVWPFAERRKHMRHVVENNDGAKPHTYFEVTE